MPDVIDEVLNEDIEEPTPDEEASQRDDTDKVEDEDLQEPTTADLLARLEESEKANKGLRKGISELRAEKNQYRDEVQGIKAAIAEIKSKRTSGEDPTPKMAETTIDDDGNIKVPHEEIAKVVKEVVGGVSQDVAQLKDNLTQQATYTQQQEAAQKAINQVIASDPAFPAAYQKLKQAFDYLDGELATWEKENNRRVGSPDIALEIFEQEGVESEFAKKFPDLDIDTVARSHGSQRSLRKALQSVSVEEEPSKTEPDKTIATKPPSLATVTDRGGKVNKLERIASLPQKDVDDLNDAEAEELERYLSKLEE